MANLFEIDKDRIILRAEAAAIVSKLTQVRDAIWGIPDGGVPVQARFGNVILEGKVDRLTSNFQVILVETRKYTPCTHEGAPTGSLHSCDIGRTFVGIDNVYLPIYERNPVLRTRKTRL